MMRLDVEDVREQQAKLDAARDEYANRLDRLAHEATDLAKRVRRAKRANPSTDQLYAAWRDAGVAEEALDLAAYDLRTASGEDG